MSTIEKPVTMRETLEQAVHLANELGLYLNHAMDLPWHGKQKPSLADALKHANDGHLQLLFALRAAQTSIPR